jgi:hypothetical protein
VSGQSEPGSYASAPFLLVLKLNKLSAFAGVTAAITLLKIA